LIALQATLKGCLHRSPGPTVWRQPFRVALLGLIITSIDCSRGPITPPPSNELLIVGYDREPDTLNRFSTHILEDIQTCVIEGLTITDEHMNVVPLLASEVPTLQNGGVRLRSRGRMAQSSRWCGVKSPQPPENEAKSTVLACISCH